MNREELLQQVQALAFVVKDVNLFLNTHPYSQAALNFYAKYNTLYLEALAEYESQFGPISVDSVNIADGWSWINMPWPWEMEG